MSDQLKRKKGMGFKKKGVYHSEMVAAGPVIIELAGPVKSNDKGPFIAIKCDGQDHYLNIENPVIEAELKKYPKGATLKVQASGKGEQARLAVQPQNESSAPLPKAESLPSLLEELTEAWKAVDAVVPSTEDGRSAIVNTLLIQRFANPNRRWSGAAPVAVPQEERPAQPSAAPAPAVRLVTEDAPHEQKSFFLHRRFDGGKHQGKNWLEVIDQDPSYVDWSINKGKGYSDEQRQWLRELQQEVAAQPSGEDPFAEDVIRGSDGQPLF